MEIFGLDWCEALIVVGLLCVVRVVGDDDGCCLVVRRRVVWRVERLCGRGWYVWWWAATLRGAAEFVSCCGLVWCGGHHPAGGRHLDQFRAVPDLVAHTGNDVGKHRNATKYCL